MRLIALAALATLAAGQNVFITQPITDTIWTVGQQVQVRWQSKTGDTLPDKAVNVDLMWGPTNALQRIQGLGCAPTSTQFLAYTVNEDLPSSKNYSIRVGTTSYSVVFQIVNPKVNDTGKAPSIAKDITCDVPKTTTSGAEMQVAGGLLASASLLVAAMMNL
jgi:hypothetical protein